MRIIGIKCWLVGPTGVYLKIEPACLHTAFSIDNIAVVEAVYSSPEHIRNDRSPVKPWPDCIDGYSTPSKGPGLGVDVDEERLNEAALNFKERQQPKLRAYDGSVRDW
jgi:L-alanine-DL-glutamate epimerase-like enolase superfamily enzyme